MIRSPEFVLLSFTVLPLKLQESCRAEVLNDTASELGRFALYFVNRELNRG